ncbi:hypothetical protein N0V94_003187 [Neodidymelliopsis sp. IMI 364377]|nr:hypothetical protein N0V94_003187 [Neodidymelliopsis sp. IMI 364377]
MATTSGATTSGDPDMMLIGELMESISRHPSAIVARKLLVEHYIAVGWLEAAVDDAKELRTLAPGDEDVVRFLKVLEKAPDLPAPERKVLQKKSPVQTVPLNERLQWDPKSGQYRKVMAPKVVEKKTEVLAVSVGGDLDGAQQDLIQGYQALRAKAGFILADLMHLQALQKKAGVPQSRNTARIQGILSGQKSLPQKLPSPREIARTIRDSPKDATDIAIADFEDAMRWVTESHGQSSNTSADATRDAIVKRKAAIELALPDYLKIHCEHALMHIEHENLYRNYANTETMYGDEVKDIPRANFYVTEDNYAWDLEELVAAIKASSGVLRNPLSKQMFTPKDVKGIYMHPLAKPLAALAVEQKELSKGVRPDTIERMEKLSKVLLEDQSADTIPSRHAVDEFLAYVATLPELEQKAIDGLKCPAKDSHTGQAYDSSIGEAMRDAKGNRVCFHKTGDFIGQAAAHLRQNRGVALDPEKCGAM